MQETVQKGFRLSMADPKILKEGINAISNLIIEANLKIKPEGLELVSMDPANVSMVIFKMGSSAFTEYNVSEVQTMGLNISNLKQILRRLKPDEILSMELQENKLMISAIGKVAKTFNLPLIDLEEKEQKIPDLKFSLRVALHSLSLADAIEDVDVVAESATFAVDSKKFCITAQGEASNANIEFPKGDATSIKLEGDSKITSKYSIEYLRKMINGSRISSIAVIQFSKDYPLKLEFKEKDHELSYILAPRVEDD